MHPLQFDAALQEFLGSPLSSGNGLSFWEMNLLGTPKDTGAQTPLGDGSSWSIPGTISPQVTDAASKSDSP